ncbi:hypothetical protein [Peribacillus muralis]|uniref:hypothetical protein n=1 Tax=Peribacillus muralis TaxID=264697 RepID=UPI003D015650
MLSFKKTIVGLIVIWSLAACDCEQVQKNEIIIMPNEEPVTYKKTDSMPYDFNPEYEWGN